MKTFSRAAIGVIAATALGLGSITVGGPASAAPAKHHKPPPKPTITSIKPNHGSTKGGTAITIRGTHISNVRKVMVGSKTIKKVYPLGRAKVQIAAPAHSAGTVHIRVVTKAGISAKHADDKFRYVKPTPPVGMHWKTSGPLEPTAGTPLDISCPTASFCAAVDADGAALTFNGTSWSAPTHLSNDLGPGQVQTVSCASASFCVAVGEGYDDVVQEDLSNTYVYNGTKWTTLAHDLGDLVSPSVSCLTTTYCMLTAGDVGANADVWAKFNGVKWTNEKVIDATNELAPEAVSCTSSTFCVAVGNSYNDYAAASIFDGTSWGTVKAIGAMDSTVSDVSCASTTYCAAVGGSYTGTDANAYDYNGTTWTTKSIDVATSGEPGVSCPTVTTCVAVGGLYTNATDGGAWAATLASTTWTVDSETTLGGGFDAVSCASAAACTAVGKYLVPLSSYTDNIGLHNVQHNDGYAARRISGDWQDPISMDPDLGRGLTGISCTSVSFCVVTDRGGSALVFNGVKWSAPYPVAVDHAQVNLDTQFGGPDDVSCASPTFCALVGADVNTEDFDNFGYASEWNGTKWTSIANIDPGYAPLAVSCASATRCVAGDDNGQIITYDGTWLTPKKVDGDQYFAAMSCVGASFCAGVDQGGNAVTTTDGTTWTVTAVDPSEGLSDVSCTSTTFCLATSAAGSASSYDGTSWSTPTTIAASTNAGGHVSCVSPSYCVAVDSSTATGYTYNGHTWDNGRQVDSTRSHGGGTTGLDCVSTKLCFATDYFGNVSVGAG